LIDIAPSQLIFNVAGQVFATSAKNLNVCPTAYAPGETGNVKA
jgi:hypothetical protein